MRAVGIRELKNRLSHYLRLVRSGETVLVTDHGSVVAEIRQPGSLTPSPDLPPGLARLLEQGLASGGASNDAALYRGVPRRLPEGSALRLLDEERGER